MKLDDIFSREIVLWRCIRALSCLLFLHLLLPMSLCNLYCTVIAEGILNPITIARNLAMSFVLPSKLLNLTVPALCFIGLSRVHVHSYAVTGWVPVQRWEWWRRFLTVRVLMGMLSVTMACVILATFYTSLAHPSFPRLFLRCSPQDVVCWPRKLAIISVGVCVGLSFALKYFLNNGNLVTLTPVHPRKLQLIKSNLTLTKLKEACDANGASKFSLICTLCICLSVGALGHLTGGGSWADLVGVVMELPLIVMILLSTVLLSTTLYLFMLSFQVFLAEPIEIPLANEEDGNPSDEDSWRLSNALTSSGLLQLLAFWDLKNLSSVNPTNYLRRSQIFAISQPGGHPRNWLGIMNPSLNLIRKFTERLRRHNCPEELPKVPIKPTEGTGKLSTDVNKNEVLKSPPVPLRERIITGILSLKGYPVFSYFLSDLPDATNRSIFAEALPVIWAVQALGDLVAASFTEDKFGVVQRNIPDVLLAFTQLQKMVDIAGRMSVSRRASTGDTNYQIEQQLRKALKLSLRSALYTVTTTFGPSLLEIPVTVECQSKLQSYLEFKEA